MACNLFVRREPVVDHRSLARQWGFRLDVKTHALCGATGRSGLPGIERSSQVAPGCRVCYHHPKPHAEFVSCSCSCPESWISVLPEGSCCQLALLCLPASLCSQRPPLRLAPLPESWLPTPPSCLTDVWASPHCTDGGTARCDLGLGGPSPHTPCALITHLETYGLKTSLSCFELLFLKTQCLKAHPVRGYCPPSWFYLY